MCSNIQRSFAPLWQLLAAAYVCIGVASSTGSLRFGLWLPGHIANDVWTILWLVCAVFTWQSRWPGVRGALSITPCALCAFSFLLDWGIMQFTVGDVPREPSIGTLAEAALWVVISCVIVQLTRMDEPGGGS